MMLIDLAIAWVLGAVIGWLAHDLYQNGVEAKRGGWKPTNRRSGDRLRLYR